MSTVVTCKKHKVKNMPAMEVKNTIVADLEDFVKKFNMEQKFKEKYGTGIHKFTIDEGKTDDDIIEELLQDEKDEYIIEIMYGGECFNIIKILKPIKRRKK